jgi:hypothetical protein
MRPISTTNWKIIGKVALFELGCNVKDDPGARKISCPKSRGMRRTLKYAAVTCPVKFSLRETAKLPFGRELKAERLSIDPERCRRVDFAQDRESFDLAQDREPVERPVERPVEWQMNVFRQPLKQGAWSERRKVAVERVDRRGEFIQNARF